MTDIPPDSDSLYLAPILLGSKSATFCPNLAFSKTTKQYIWNLK